MSFKQLYDIALMELINKGHCRPTFNPINDPDNKLYQTIDGFVFYKEVGNSHKELLIDFIYVCEHARGCGAGKKLVDDIRAKYPHHNLVANIYDTNEGSKKLFEKLGFQMSPCRYYRLASQ